VGKAKNDESRTRAHHHKDRWSIPEMQMALREDMPVRELAALLGRTRKAIGSARRRAKSPKYRGLI
jgi:hypothetical protein